MKYIFADSLDFVDPNYDFETDRSPIDREPYWDDEFPHEILNYAPYDGVLISRAVVGGPRVPGLYRETLAMYFQRVGVREFLRFRKKDFPDSIVMGDCGAFSYHKLHEPPYTTEEMIEFYADGQFDFGCSTDHIIFDFVENSEVEAMEPEKMIECKRRSEITLFNASEFISKSKEIGNGFQPMGVVQGWSPESMATAAKELQKMGYEYIAVGGMVPLNSKQIKSVLSSIRNEVRKKMKIHILGFAKADQIHEFGKFRLASFDTTSPLVRAFIDAKRNYFKLNENLEMEYYTAIRIPQAIENASLKRLAKEGVYKQEELQQRESNALHALRAYDKGEIRLSETLREVMSYSEPLTIDHENKHNERNIQKLKTLEERYKRTLSDKPWQSCECKICCSAGVEVIIFRGSNRNKRRGIHNLQTYGKLIKSLEW